MAFLKTDLTTGTDLREHGAGTGPERRQRPVYVDFMPPCNNACPAGENIQAWLSLAQAGDHRRAWEKLIEDNPLAGDPRPRLLSPVRDRRAIAALSTHQ